MGLKAQEEVPQRVVVAPVALNVNAFSETPIAEETRAADEAEVADAGAYLKNVVVPRFVSALFVRLT